MDKTKYEAALAQSAVELRSAFTAWEANQTDEALEAAYNTAEVAHQAAQRAFDRAAAVAAASDAIPAPTADVAADHEEAVAETRSLADVAVTHEPSVYTAENRSHTWTNDLILRSKGNKAAAERLDKYSQENISEGRVEERALDRGDGTGADVIPPVWASDVYEKSRVRAPVAARMNKSPLPATGSVISKPIFGPATTAVQAADLDDFQDSTPATDHIDLPVATLAGVITLSAQQLERSPYDVERYVLNALYADLAKQKEAQVVKGTGINGQIKGLLTVSGINSQTYTDASPTVPELLPQLAKALGLTYDEVDTLVLNRAKWAWLTSALDSTGRPLIVPTNNGPSNAVSTINGNPVYGFVGQLQAVPTFISQAVPSNLGSGTNESWIIGFNSSTTEIMESTPSVLVNPYAQGSNGGVEISARQYVAADCSESEPSNIVLIKGTGLITP